MRPSFVTMCACVHASVVFQVLLLASEAGKAVLKSHKLLSEIAALLAREVVSLKSASGDEPGYFCVVVCFGKSVDKLFFYSQTANAGRSDCFVCVRGRSLLSLSVCRSVCLSALCVDLVDVFDETNSSAIAKACRILARRAT
jgi:hypothetical protein